MIFRMVLALALLTGCAGAATPLDDDDIALASSLVPFDDCDALTGRLREHALRQVDQYGLVTGPVAGAADGARAGAGDAGGVALESVAAQPAPGGGGFSTTNVQEVGVDEADLAKTDGDWLYTVPDGTTVRVVDVRADEPAVVATIPLGDGGTARELLLSGDRLLVIGDVFAPTEKPTDADASTADVSVGAEMILPAPSRTKLWLVDVGDPTRPDVLSTMALDGWSVATRLTDETARVVLRSPLTGPAMMVSATGEAREQQRVADVNRQRIRDSIADDWLPRVQVDDGEARPLVECREIYEPRGFTDLGLVTVLSLDMTVPELAADRARAVLGAAEAVYANEEHLYVTTSRWPTFVPGAPMPVEPMPDAPAAMPEAMPERMPQPVDPSSPSPADASSVAPEPPVVREAPSVAPEPAPEPAPSPREPAPLPEESERPAAPASPPAARTASTTTEVHQFDLTDDGAGYVASGSVPGRLLNQWAMSEHEGDLRIATTEDDLADARRSHSSVRILRERNGRLRQIGRVPDLGRGEQIYAVRYAGDIGFVVTFRQVDPLYTLDLSDPTAPRLLGELKVPGYSSYLHPIDDDHLLGVGQNADKDGRTTGVQVSLFDVADLERPRRVARLALGSGTMTDVEFDHRAFLYWPQERTAVLPLAEWLPNGRVGAVVLQVDPRDGVVERGFVQHAPVQGMPPPPVQRAFVVDDRLITITYAGVLTSDLNTLHPLGETSYVR
jgi:uncharacterized secreted protein with C-terminal beta-propeller domain